MRRAAVPRGSFGELDWETVGRRAPRCGPGVVSSLIMSQAAQEAGLDQPVGNCHPEIYVNAGLCWGNPLTAHHAASARETTCWRRYKRRHFGRLGRTNKHPPRTPNGPRALVRRKLPEAYNTVLISNSFGFGLLPCLHGAFSGLLTRIFTISAFVVCLVFGVIATSVRVLER